MLEIAAERIGWINEVCGETWLTRADDGLIGARNLAANIKSLDGSLSFDAGMAKCASGNGRPSAARGREH